MNDPYPSAPAELEGPAPAETDRTAADDAAQSAHYHRLRWFALALHKEPDNPSLQNDLQKLWSQMTQPERQLAIKLSQ